MALAVSNRDGGKTSERGLYDSIGSLFAGKVLSGFRVRQADPAGMRVRIGGEGRDSALIKDGLRTYSVFTDDGSAVITDVPAAHTSLKRIDAVVVYIDKSVGRVKTPVDNANGVVKAKVVPGTPNASPSAPTDSAIQSSVQAGNPFTKLATIEVDANATTILANKITDIRSGLTTPGVLTTDASGGVSVSSKVDNVNGWKKLGNTYSYSASLSSVAISDGQTRTITIPAPTGIDLTSPNVSLTATPLCSNSGTVMLHFTTNLTANSVESGVRCMYPGSYTISKLKVDAILTVS